MNGICPRLLMMHSLPPTSLYKKVSYVYRFKYNALNPNILLSGGEKMKLKVKNMQDSSVQQVFSVIIYCCSTTCSDNRPAEIIAVNLSDSLTFSR